MASIFATMTPLGHGTRAMPISNGAGGVGLTPLPWNGVFCQPRRPVRRAGLRGRSDWGALGSARRVRPVGGSRSRLPAGYGALLILRGPKAPVAASKLGAVWVVIDHHDSSRNERVNACESSPQRLGVVHHPVRQEDGAE